MKRLLPIFTVLLLLLTGCQITEKSKTESLPTSFTAEVEIKTNTGKYKALLEHSDVRTRLIYSEPLIISGLTLTKSAEGCTAEVAGLTVSSSSDYFTDRSTINLIDKVLGKALYSSGEALETAEFDERIILKGVVDGIQFELTRYSNKPEIISISVPSENLIVNFI